MLGLVLLLAGCMDFLAGAEEDYEAGLTCSDPAPLHEGEDVIPNEYIVVFEYDRVADAEALTARLAETYDFTPMSVYTHAIKGFAAELSPEALAGLRCEPLVDFVEPNQRGGIEGADS